MCILAASEVYAVCRLSDCYGSRAFEEREGDRGRQKESERERETESERLRAVQKKFYYIFSPLNGA